MKCSQGLVRLGLVTLLAVAAESGVVPPKAGLSHKDKLALEIPVKQHPSDKTLGKQEPAKVAFPSTTTSSTTTTTTTTTPQPQRPKYVDAAVFRHQFTTPPTNTPSEGSFDDEVVVDREISRVVDRESGSNPDAFRTATKIVRVPTLPEEELPRDPESFDYEAHFELLDDVNPFDGELGIFGDSRSAGYISAFRPLAF